MELEFIKNLAQIMNDAGLGELEYRQGTDSLVLRTKSNAYSNMLSSHLLGSNIENINQEKLSNISFGLQNNMDSHNTNMGPISSDDSSNVGECPSDKVLFIRVHHLMNQYLPRLVTRSRRDRLSVS